MLQTDMTNILNRSFDNQGFYLRVARGRVQCGRSCVCSLAARVLLARSLQRNLPYAVVTQIK